MLGAHGKYIDRAVKKYDRKLFAAYDFRHTLCLFRERFSYDCFDINGHAVFYGRPNPEFVFALTDNWTQKGKPIPWGAEPVLARLRQIDFWDNQRFFQELDKANELIDESSKKSLRNKCEAIASEWRGAFKKGFDWVNTSTLNKKLDPRRKYDGIK